MKDKDQPTEGIKDLDSQPTTGNKKAANADEPSVNKTAHDEASKDQPPIANKATDAVENTAGNENGLNQSKLDKNDLPPTQLGDA